MASRIRVGPARMPSRESPEEAIELLLERGYSACEIDFESGFWMDYPFAERLGELAREHDVALSVHAPLVRLHGPPRGERAQVHIGRRRARPQRGHRRRERRRARRLPPRLPARTEPRGRDRRGRRAARQAPRAARGEGARRAVRHRGDGPRARARVGRRRRRDLAARRLGAAGARLRAHARDERRRVPRARRRSARRSSSRTTSSSADAPFHIHFSDIAFANRNETKHLPVRRGDAARGAAARRARALRAPGDRDLRVARRGVESGDPLGAHVGSAGASSASRAS